MPIPEKNANLIQHRGSVDEVCRELQLAERIDGLVSREKRKVSIGTEHRFVYLDTTTFSLHRQYDEDDDEKAGLEFQPSPESNGGLLYFKAVEPTPTSA